MELLRNAAEKCQEKASSSGEESDDRFTNSSEGMFGQEMSVVPFCDSVGYFEEGNSLLEIDEQLPDLQKWWEF